MGGTRAANGVKSWLISRTANEMSEQSDLRKPGIPDLLLSSGLCLSASLISSYQREERVMARFIVRDLEEAVKTRLKRRAAGRGRSRG